MAFTLYNGQAWWDRAGKRSNSWLPTKYYTFNGQRIAMRDETGLYYLHQDQLGSTLLVTNGSGNTVDDHGYYAYGRDRRGTELRTAQRFTGHLTDGTGLIYMNARYYDPQLGQFISPDTLVPDATQLMDFNRYAYARGNPMKYNDPSGHCGTAVVSGGSTAALDLTCWEIMGAAASEVAAPAAAAAATVAVVGGGYLAAQWAMQDNGPTVPPLYPTLGHNVGDGNISITIPVPNSTTVTSGVPLTSDNQTAIAGVTPVNSQAQQIVEPLPQAPKLADQIYTSIGQQIQQQGQLVSGNFPKTANTNGLLYRVDKTGVVTNYQVYDTNGNPVKRVDLTGRSHGGIATPHVVEFEQNLAPDGTIFIKPSNQVRPARPDEIP